MAVLKGLFTLAIPNGWQLAIFLFRIAAFMLYRTIARHRWAYWKCLVFMRETEDVIMSGDSTSRVAGLCGVNRRTAKEFAKAVEQAVSQTTPIHV